MPLPKDECLHEDRWIRHERLLARFATGRHVIFEWMVISAAIAVLILTYHIYSNMHKMAEVTSRMENQNAEQNRLLGEIHNAIHEETKKRAPK